MKKHLPTLHAAWLMVFSAMAAEDFTEIKSTAVAGNAKARIAPTIRYRDGIDIHHVVLSKGVLLHPAFPINIP